MMIQDSIGSISREDSIIYRPSLSEIGKFIANHLHPNEPDYFYIAYCWDSSKNDFGCDLFRGSGAASQLFDVAMRQLVVCVQAVARTTTTT